MEHCIKRCLGETNGDQVKNCLVKCICKIIYRYFYTLPNAQILIILTEDGGLLERGGVASSRGLKRVRNIIT